MKRCLMTLFLSLQVLSMCVPAVLANEAEETTQGNEEVETEDVQAGIAQIQRKYEELRQANKSRTQDLQREMESCGGDSYCTRSAELRIQANERYTEYLQAQEDYEVAQYNLDNECRAGTTNCSPDEVNRIKQGRDAIGRAVREILSELEQRDRARNQEATLDASRIFSLEGQEDRPQRSFLEVSNTIADWMITIVSSLAVTTLIIGGFLMIISGGDENRLETGKTIFSYSLIGLLVTLLAYGIISFLQSIFYLGSA